MKTPRISLALLSLGMAAGVLVADSPVPTNKPTTYPSWWFSRNVVVQTTPPVTNPNWPDNYLEADDYAAVNLGQLKQMATAAYDEFTVHLPGGTMSALDTLVKGWFQLDANGNFLLDDNGNRIPAVTANTNDYAAANLGQVKAVAQGFYDRLITVTYASQYPWTGGSADDYAGANLGQLKNLFSFDLRSTDATHDTDQNGLPDWWERYYFGHIGLDPNALAPSGDGLTIGQKFQGGVNPDLYQTVPPDQQSPIQLIVYTNLE